MACRVLSHCVSFIFSKGERFYTKSHLKLKSLERKEAVGGRRFGEVAGAAFSQIGRRRSNQQK